VPPLQCSLVLTRLFVVQCGNIQQPACVQRIPRSLIYVLEPIRAEESATEISRHNDKDVVYLLEGGECTDPENRIRIYQNLQKMSQSTACGGLPVVVVIWQPIIDNCNQDDL
jgi:hypothetical protein